MINDKLQEKRIHGSYLLPIGVYDVDLGDKEYFITAHWHNEIEILIVKEGEFNLQINSEFYSCKKGDIVFINSGELHYFSAKENTFSAWTSLVFDMNHLNSNVVDSCSINFISPIINKEFKLPTLINSNDSIHKDLSLLLLRLIEVYNNEYYGFELEIKGLMLTFFSILFRGNLIDKNININSDENKVYKIKNVLNYIENNYNNEISVATLANICHYNDQHFIRFFKKYTGKTCTQFIKNYRLEKAMELIKNSDYPITQISLDTGFPNVSYFIKSFKEKYNVTPKEFRNSNMNYF